MSVMEVTVQGQEQADVQHCLGETEFSLPPPFCATQTLSGLDYASPPHIGKKNLLLGFSGGKESTC